MSEGGSGATSGELEETVQGQASRTLKVGDWQYVPGDTAHTLTNKTQAPATFMAIISGKKDELLTVPFKKQ